MGQQKPRKQLWLSHGRRQALPNKLKAVSQRSQALSWEQISRFEICNESGRCLGGGHRAEAGHCLGALATLPLIPSLTALQAPAHPLSHSIKTATQPVGRAGFVILSSRELVGNASIPLEGQWHTSLGPLSATYWAGCRVGASEHR